MGWGEGWVTQSLQLLKSSWTPLSMLSLVTTFPRAALGGWDAAPFSPSLLGSPLNLLPIPDQTEALNPTLLEVWDDRGKLAAVCSRGDLSGMPAKALSRGHRPHSSPMGFWDNTRNAPTTCSLSLLLWEPSPSTAQGGEAPAGSNPTFVHRRAFPL